MTDHEQTRWERQDGFAHGLFSTWLGYMAWGYGGLLLSFPAYYSYRLVHQNLSLHRTQHYRPFPNVAVLLHQRFLLAMIISGLAIWLSFWFLTSWQERQDQWLDHSLLIISKLPPQVMGLRAMRYLLVPTWADRTFSALFRSSAYVKQRAWNRERLTLQMFRSIAEREGVSWHKGDAYDPSEIKEELNEIEAAMILASKLEEGTKTPEVTYRSETSKLDDDFEEVRAKLDWLHERIRALAEREQAERK